jgi:hypothetical protein
VSVENYLLIIISYIHTYHKRLIPEEVAELSQIFLRGTHVLTKLVSYEEHWRHDKVYSDVSAINPLVTI